VSKFWKRLFGQGADDLPAGNTAGAEERVPSRSKGEFREPRVDAAVRADRLIRATTREVASNQLAFVEKNPTLRLLIGKAEAWQFCVLAASIGLAVMREERTPSIIDTVDRILARDNPSLREAVGDFLKYLVARGQSNSRVDLPTYIGYWVMRNLRGLSRSQRDFEEASYSTVGNFCLRMGGSWDIEREPSLLVYRFRSAALDLSLLRKYPELADIDEESWELLFTLACFVAATMAQGGEELLDDPLSLELSALHPAALDLFGACAGFVSRFLSSLQDKTIDPDLALAIALGTWILLRGFGRQLGPEEDDLVYAVGQQVVNSVRAVS
jgi:hypothetical protein